MSSHTPTPVFRRAPRAALCAVLGAVVLAATIGAPIAGAADAKYEGISTDGQIAIFSTTDKLIPGDTDNHRDIYQRAFDPVVGDYVTRQLSLGPTGGNNAFDATYYGIDPLGTTVSFSTAERLTPDDTDSATDVYLRDLVDNTTARVSRGEAGCEPGCGNGGDPSSPVPEGVSADGGMVFFATSESLSVNDGDTSLDIYARDVAADSTALVSRGDVLCEPGCGRDAFPAFFRGASESGGKALFTTGEGMVDGDGDGAVDIYQRDLIAGTTQLVSVTGTSCGSPNCNPASAGISDDGSHVFFETNDRISAEDTDSSQDVYDWSDGVVTLASAGEVSCQPGCGNGAANALFAGSSHTGETVFFKTTERLDTGADSDDAQDVYARVGGATELVSAGEASCLPSCGNDDFPATLQWVSPLSSSSAVVFSTAESLSSLDGDGSQDVYVRDLAADTTTLVSRADSSCVTPDCGDGDFDAGFARASDDGSHVFFVTEEALVPTDTDARTDVYERSGGVTTLVSAGDEEIYGNGPFDAQLHGISDDGSRAFFVTRERMAQTDDFYDENDVYMRSSSGTRLISVGNGEGLVLGPPAPSLRGTSPASPNVSTTPSIFGQAAAGALIKIYTNSDCTGDVAATGTAEELAGPGIQVTVATGSTTSFWATAEAEGVTSSCSTRAVSYTQQNDSPPPPPPPDPGSGGASGGSSGSTGTLKPGGIVYLTPQTRITFAPGVKTRTRNPVFRFTDSTGQEGTKFFCKLDRRAWGSCGSPKKLKKLKRGRHVFQVKAMNAVGEWEPRPVKHTFKLVSG